jgi:hypothetical protein
MIYGSNDPKGHPPLYDEINKQKNKNKFFISPGVRDVTWHT